MESIEREKCGYWGHAPGRATLLTVRKMALREKDLSGRCEFGTGEGSLTQGEGRTGKGDKGA